ncbi:MAG: YicC/YloC family endoribonuclease [Alistipes sp.]|nr:YicC/YloC family endoribonuclease [Alistipes sp.]
MVKSMTGFGKGEALAGDKKFVVELRSVNSKQFDLSLKMQSRYRAAEVELRSILTQGIKRGKVDCFVSVESSSVESSAHINKQLFKAYTEQLRDASMESSFDTNCVGWDGYLLQAVLRMPDVISSEEQAVSDSEIEAICEAARVAVERLDSFRLQEGAVLIADLLQRVDNIERYKQEVEPYEKSRTETIRSRMLENLSKLNIEVDRNRLEQEMIYYLEKLDITEEKVRLKQHCDYFREVAANESEPGRKLGFIAQEMGREINTLGSKSNEANMQILVVKMKDELEKIKEQVLNIL